LGIAWASGGAGNPAYAQAAKTNLAAQQQALQGRIPLSQGAMLAATPSTGSGGGSGGGSGNCLRAEMLVLSRERGSVPISCCHVGDHILTLGHGGVGPEGKFAWTAVKRIEILPADTFIRLHFSNHDTLDVTPHHIFTLADGSPMRAERLCLADIFIGRNANVTLQRIEVVREEGKKVTVSCSPSHEFYAGKDSASILTHNYTFSS